LSDISMSVETLW